MDPQTTPPPGGPFWVRHKAATLIGGLLLTMLCGVGLILLVIFLSVPSPTPGQEKLALQALADPASAPITLGHYGDNSRWGDQIEGDYTVQDGMVIFAQPGRKQTYESGIPVMVYAPDGRNLADQPALPTGAAVKSYDWFLIRCQAVPFHTSWWNCGLIFGGRLF